MVEVVPSKPSDFALSTTWRLFGYPECKVNRDDLDPCAGTGICRSRYDRETNMTWFGHHLEHTFFSWLARTVANIIEKDAK